MVIWIVDNLYNNQMPCYLIKYFKIYDLDQGSSSSDLNNGIVWYLNGQNYSDYQTYWR